MTKHHPLTEALAQADDIYHTLRADALARNLTIEDFDSRHTIALLRERLRQCSGILDGFEQQL